MNHALDLNVNGTHHTDAWESRTSLLTLLREQLGLTGTKRGCEEGECGGCSVLLDGALVDSCLIFAVEAQGRAVTTVEGLGDPDNLSPLQQAFAETGASQCGFCIPGILIAATALLESHADPDDETIREGISGNLCRCTGYTRIVEAIRLAAQLRRSSG